MRWLFGQIFRQILAKRLRSPDLSRLVLRLGVGPAKRLGAGAERDGLAGKMTLDLAKKSGATASVHF